MKKPLLYAALAIGMAGCEKLLLGDVEPNTVLNNLDYFEQEFQHRYGLFEVRQLDWKALVQPYREQLQANPNEKTLHQVLTEIIRELDDSHISLSHPVQAFESFDGGTWGRLQRAGYKDMDFEVVSENYLSLINAAEEDRAFYGTVAGNIGYLHLPEVHDDPEFWKSYMPRVIDDLANTVGMIIDLRNNEGGEDESSRVIAGFFASQPIHYMKSRYKTGRGPNDFGETLDWYLEPAGERYLKPIVILTNRYTISAGETFALAMRELPHVTHMGDTTCGAFSDAVSRQLPNGWQFSLSVGDYRDAHNVSHERIGLVPEIWIRNTASDLAAGQDKVLEAAIDLLQ